MKKLLLTILPLFLLIFLFQPESFGQERSASNPLKYKGIRNPKPGNKAYMDFKGGFKEFVLGNEVSLYKDRLEDFTLIDNEIYKLYKVRGADTLTINNIPIKGIIIGSFEDHVAKIVVQVDQKDGDEIVGILEEAYGWPNKNNRYLDVYYWYGNEVVIDFDFEEGPISNIIFSSKTIVKQAKKKEKTLIKKRVKDI